MLYIFLFASNVVICNKTCLCSNESSLDRVGDQWSDDLRLWGRDDSVAIILASIRPHSGTPRHLSATDRYEILLAQLFYRP